MTQRYLPKIRHITKWLLSPFPFPPIIFPPIFCPPRHRNSPFSSASHSRHAFFLLSDGQPRPSHPSPTHPAPVGHNFGVIMDDLVGARNFRTLTEARKAYQKAHPIPEMEPLSSPERVLLDRQLKEICDAICERRWVLLTLRIYVNSIEL